MSKMAIVNAMYISESDFPRELMTKKHHQNQMKNKLS
jgi:hypothetical protein